MQGRDAALVKENERLKMSIGVLEEEHLNYEGELERVREKCEKIRNEVEDD
jgi:hypothetical protein